MTERELNSIQRFGKKKQKEIDHYDDLEADRGIPLKCILEKYDGKEGLAECVWFRTDQRRASVNKCTLRFH
jgi:hypothetical protein